MIHSSVVKKYFKNGRYDCLPCTLNISGYDFFKKDLGFKTCNFLKGVGLIDIVFSKDYSKNIEEIEYLSTPEMALDRLNGLSLDTEYFTYRSGLCGDNTIYNEENVFKLSGVINSKFNIHSKPYESLDMIIIDNCLISNSVWNLFLKEFLKVHYTVIWENKLYRLEKI